VTCKQLRPKLYLMADKELPADEVKPVESHLRHCRQCKSLYDSLLLENERLSTALAVHRLPEDEIRFLEQRVMPAIVAPPRLAVVERLVSVREYVFPLVAVVVSCLALFFLQTDTAVMYEETAKELMQAGRPAGLMLNLVVAILVAILTVLPAQFSRLAGKIMKGGIQPCL